MRLAEAHKRLQDEGYKYHIYILGEGEEQEKIQSYLDKNQIDWKGQSAVAVISRQLETSVMGNSTVEALH